MDVAPVTMFQSGRNEWQKLQSWPTASTAGTPLYLKPGGALVYIVCSLLDAEGTDQVTWFLNAHPGWTTEPLSLPAGAKHGHGVRLEPGRDGTDGFFVARLRAAC